MVDCSDWLLRKYGKDKGGKRRNHNLKFSFFRSIWDLRKRSVIWNSALRMKTKPVFPHLSGCGRRMSKPWLRCINMCFLNLYFLLIIFCAIDSPCLHPFSTTYSEKKGRTCWYFLLFLKNIFNFLFFEEVFQMQFFVDDSCRKVDGAAVPACS